ncbi:hypothetical protein FJ250_00500 [bacterium]|nr:hypothetical protein [bacterium]
MVRLTPLLLVLAAAAAVLASAGCQQEKSGAGFGWKPLFGDLAKDTSPAIAEVGEITITQADLEQFIDEQPTRNKAEYAGPEGERLALKRMVDSALLVMGAVERKLYNDQTVARTLVANRRVTLEKAMRQYGLLKDAAPTDAEMREYYEKNLGRFRQLGMVRVRHIECKDRAAADQAYRRLQSKAPKDGWVYVCADFSTNERTKKIEGDAGWMNAGSIVPLIDAGAEFSKAVFDLPIGVNPPLSVAGRWHVVEITHREFERNSTYDEGKDTIKNDLLPGYQDAIIKNYLKEARAKHGVQYLGRFTPGQGMTPQQLFERAMFNQDILRRIDILLLIAQDFPDSDRADDAMFMAANTAIENISDLSVGARILESLIELYPQSEYVDDANFILENLYNPKFQNPTSIEDIRR